MNSEIFMKEALAEAKKAGGEDEIPIGAVIVLNDEIIARAHNQNRQENNATRHAEIIAIERASAHLRNERLTDCVLYVTKEPCAMCAGAIVHSRLKRVIIAAKDIKYGACGTVLSVCGSSILNHVPEIEFGLFEKESAALLKKFFKMKREK